MAMIFSNVWVFANHRTNVDSSQTMKINYGCCISSLLWIQRTSLHSASQYYITHTNHTSEKFTIETLRKIDARKQLPSFLSFQKVMSDTDVLAHSSLQSLRKWKWPKAMLSEATTHSFSLITIKLAMCQNELT